MHQMLFSVSIFVYQAFTAMVKAKSHFDEIVKFSGAVPHLGHYVRQLAVNSKNKTFAAATLNGIPPQPSLFIGALLSLHNDAEKVPRKHTKRPLSFFATSPRKPNNACKPL